MSGVVHHWAGRAAALGLAVVALASLMVPASAAPRAPLSYPAVIEPLAAYQPQKVCSPTAKPGTYAFSRLLLSAYPGTRSLGIVRACSVGGTSEHKEGRAFDWGGLSASSATDRAKVNDLMTWLFATDRHGNKYAMARRLGIQYIVWNRRIWGSYAASSGWRAYSGSSPHTDHVHFSLSWAGANKTTSFWTGKVIGPPPPPPPPATTPPARPATLPQGPALSDETVWYTATNPGALTTGALVKGERYQIEVWGTWGWSRSSGALADAECSVSPTDATWRRNRSVHPNGPDADHLDLYLDGIDLTGEPDKDAGDRCDSANHFYRAEFVPDRTGRMTFKLWDPTGLADNSGYLGIRIVRYATPNVMTMTVDARARAGRSTPGALKAGETYLVTVTGTVSVGNGVRSDAECSTTPTDPVWRRRRSLLPAEPNADHLDLLFNKDNRSGAPAVRSVADRNCDVATHRYAYVLRPAQTRPINLRVNDPVPGGNWGVLTVRFDRVVRETVSVVASSRTAAQTRGTYPANVPLNIRAIGEYAAGGGILADAECSRATATANWLTAQPTWRDRNGRSLGDVMVNGTLRAWRPTSGSGECDSVKHDYKLSATPTTASKVGFLIADTNRADNSGRILVSVELG